jgi:hypothetical protein
MTIKIKAVSLHIKKYSVTTPIPRNCLYNESILHASAYDDCHAAVMNSER